MLTSLAIEWPCFSELRCGRQLSGSLSLSLSFDLHFLHTLSIHDVAHVILMCASLSLSLSANMREERIEKKRGKRVKQSVKVELLPRFSGPNASLSSFHPLILLANHFLPSFLLPAYFPSVHALSLSLFPSSTI